MIRMGGAVPSSDKPYSRRLSTPVMSALYLRIAVSPSAVIRVFGVTGEEEHQCRQPDNDEHRGHGPKYTDTERKLDPSEPMETTKPTMSDIPASAR